jgi:hypothetical protein
MPGCGYHYTQAYLIEVSHCHARCVIFAPGKKEIHFRINQISIMKYIISLLFLASLVSGVKAQVTYTSDDFLTYFFGTPTVRWSSTDTTGVRAIEAINGSEKSWDYTGRNYTLNSGNATQPLLPYSSSAPMASDPAFTPATHIAVDSSGSITFYTFYRIDSTGFWELGESQDSMGVPSKVEVYSPPFLQLQFPLTYLATWQSTSQYIDLKYPDTTTESLSGAVDGYGTLLLPSTSPMDAIRITLRSVGTNNGYSFTDYAFLWFTKSAFWAEAQADDTLKPTSGLMYVQPTGSGVAENISNESGDGLNLLISQNPASNSVTNLSYTLANGGPVKVELMDELGRSVRMLQNGNATAGQNTIAIEPQSLEAGTYFVRVEANGMSAMQKLVIAK